MWRFARPAHAHRQRTGRRACKAKADLWCDAPAGCPRAKSGAPRKHNVTIPQLTGATFVCYHVMRCEDVTKVTSGKLAQFFIRSGLQRDALLKTAWSFAGSIAHSRE